MKWVALAPVPLTGHWSSLAAMRISPLGSTALTLVVCCVEPPALSLESEPPHAAARMPNNMTNASALRRIGFFPPEDEQRDDADAQRTRPAVSTAILSCGPISRT